MSKAAKRSLLILIVLLLATLGFAALSVIEKQAVEEEKQRVEQELVETNNQFMAKEKKYIQDRKKLNSSLEKANGEKSALTKKIKKVEEQAQEQIEALSKEIEDISNDRDKWKRRIDTIRNERDKLMVKIDGLTKKLEEKPEPQIVYKEKESRAPAAVRPAAFSSRKSSNISIGGKIADEEYWARLLQDKASLEVDIERLKDELSAKSIEVVDLKQKHENLSMEVDVLKHEKEDIEVALLHKTDMIDNISLELARTKNDKKFISGRAEKLNTENSELRQQMKQLMSVKNALEKSIVRLSQEKDKVEGKLGKTETIIQSKIDEIWEIKDDLDRSIRETQGAPSSEVELPPIVVSSNGESMSYNTGTTPGFNGKVISMNEANNFVIVNIGENKGVRLGDSLSVYRDSKYIARLEVIQVRKDISAADLKDQWSKVKVGDIIR
jgi:chromosome segregation ATPase